MKSADQAKLRVLLAALLEDVNKYEESVARAQEEELKEFLAQKIYEKEFGEVRMKSIESIIEAVEEIKIGEAQCGGAGGNGANTGVSTMT